MTVSTTTNKIITAGTGANFTFSFPFAMPATAALQAAAIQVYFTNAAGTVTLISASLYTLAVNAAVSPNPTPVGGTVTYPLTGSAIALGTTLTIIRTIPETQPTSLANQGAQYQPVMESQYDSLTMQVQQLQELLNRQITVAVSDPTPTALPAAAARASLGMGFDSSGNPIAISLAPAGTISAAMAPFVASATLAAAKALLGYGSMANENVGAAGSGIFDDGAGNARAKWTPSAVTTNQAPVAANHLTYYTVGAGNPIFTLAKLTTLFAGYSILVVCEATTAVLTPNAADNFFNLAGGVSISLAAGQAALITAKDATANWSIILFNLPNVGGPVVQLFTSGAANYTPTTGCTRAKIRICGGGGGGGAQSANAGGTGGTTTFGTWTAIGGTGGAAAAGAGGIGGTGGVDGTGTKIVRFPGGAGNGANSPNAAAAAGGMGGSNPFGGGGRGGASAGGASAGSAGATNTGAGGGGAGANGANSGAGGGAGEYVEFFLSNPTITAYTVGAAGTAGAAGGLAGGAGAAGIIIVEELFGG